MCEKHFLIHNIFLKFQHFLQKQFPDFFLGFPIIKPYRWHEKLQKWTLAIVIAPKTNCRSIFYIGIFYERD